MDAPRDNLIRATLRDAAATAITDGRTMTGYPIVFDTWTTIDSWEGTFRERVAPTALNRTLRNNGGQVKVLFNHGMDPSIGNKPLGKPVRMKPDAIGLDTETPLSETSYNDDLIALMNDGAIDGMSFRFQVVKDEWIRAKDPTTKKLPERTITELRLFEFGPVTFPAYEATTVGIRSRTDFDAWLGLDDDKRAQLAELFGISSDLRTLNTEHADGTSVEPRDDTNTERDPVGAHSQVTARERRKALALIMGVTQ